MKTFLNSEKISTFFSAPCAHQRGKTSWRLITSIVVLLWIEHSFRVWLFFKNGQACSSPVSSFPDSQIIKMKDGLIVFNVSHRRLQRRQGWRTVASLKRLGGRSLKCWRRTWRHFCTRTESSFFISDTLPQTDSGRVFPPGDVLLQGKWDGTAAHIKSRLPRRHWAALKIFAAPATGSCRAQRPRAVPCWHPGAAAGRRFLDVLIGSAGEKKHWRSLPAWNPLPFTDTLVTHSNHTKKLTDIPEDEWKSKRTWWTRFMYWVFFFHCCRFRYWRRSHYSCVWFWNAGEQSSFVRRR